MIDAFGGIKEAGGDTKRLSNAYNAMNTTKHRLLEDFKKLNVCK